MTGAYTYSAELADAPVEQEVDEGYGCSSGGALGPAWMLGVVLAGRRRRAP